MVTYDLVSLPHFIENTVNDRGFFFHVTFLQSLGTAFGVVQVLLVRKNNIDNYFFGILAILISMWVRYHAQLYGDILLDLYYLGYEHITIPIRMFPIGMLL